MKRTRLLVFVLLTLLVAPGARCQEAAAIETPSEPPPWEEIGAQLERIADLLELLVDSRKMDLITRRVEVTTARLAPLRQELSQVNVSRGKLLRERAEISEQIEMNSDQMAAGLLDVPQEQIDLFAAQMERQLSRIARDLRAADARVAELEAELGARQREIDDWQAYLDRELSGL